MRLDFVEMCGFRGFRTKARVNFGRGFTIITGRNGVGKSTICDAIEFALTGSIDKYAVKKAATETLGDYVWWRGEIAPSARYVTVGFIDDVGKPLEITRTAESSSQDAIAEIETALCVGSKPEQALYQLCKTSIIRDEWIAALSLDLTETERFDLVKSALGQSDGSDYAARAKEIVGFAESTLQRYERAYEDTRSRLTAALTQLSESKEIVASSDDMEAAMKTLSAMAPDAPSEITARLSFARSQLVSRRARLRNIEDELQQARELTALRQVRDTAETRQRIKAAKDSLAQAELVRDQSRARLKQAANVLEIGEKGDALAASLAALVDHGGRLGLHDGHCPLCDAVRTSKEFEEGIGVARRRAEALAADVMEARRKVATERTFAVQSEASYQQSETAWKAIEQETANLAAREEVHQLSLDQLGLGEDFFVNPDALQQEQDAERGRLIEMERALLTLEASHAVTRVAASEDRVAVLRRDSEAAAGELARHRASLERARLIERAIKRVGAEIIDERLAQISPLLNELYQRLRPHADWRTIQYSIRGDVRRFLSLRVGNGLNPQFVFSSGQRRAAGLAFLLAVHLTRSWARWRTLILDDPIQHIDDFRALHLVEVLAALRRDGRQILCAVEDPALADLLCRRLSVVPEQEGRKYSLELGVEGSSVITSMDLPPMTPSVLRRISSLQAAAG